MCDAGERVEDVYFPLDCVVSLDQVIVGDSDRPGAAPGIALIGCEGAAGIEFLFGGETWINRTTVRIGGKAVRVDAEVMREEFVRGGAFHRLVLRFADAMFAQIAGVGACERVHPVEQRFVRWLLSFDDRVSARDLG